MFAFLLPEIVIEVVYLTAEAFLLSGSSVATIAKSAKSSPNRRAFEAITNCSAQLYSTRSIVKGDGVHWGKAEGRSQSSTTS